MGYEGDYLWYEDDDYWCRLLADDTCKETVRRWKENGKDVVKNFKYNLPFDWHFCYRHVVDDHNNLRHELPSIEDTWMIHPWEFRVFAFISDISEVNAFLFYTTLSAVGYIGRECLRY